MKQATTSKFIDVALIWQMLPYWHSLIYMQPEKKDTTKK